MPKFKSLKTCVQVTLKGSDSNQDSDIFVFTSTKNLTSYFLLQLFLLLLQNFKFVHTQVLLGSLTTTLLVALVTGFTQAIIIIWVISDKIEKKTPALLEHQSASKPGNKNQLFQIFRRKLTEIYCKGDCQDSASFFKESWGSRINEAIFSRSNSKITVAPSLLEKMPLATIRTRVGRGCQGNFPESIHMKVLSTLTFRHASIFSSLSCRGKTSSKSIFLPTDQFPKFTASGVPASECPQQNTLARAKNNVLLGEFWSIFPGDFLKHQLTIKASPLWRGCNLRSFSHS